MGPDRSGGTLQARVDGSVSTVDAPTAGAERRGGRGWDEEALYAGITGREGDSFPERAGDDRPGDDKRHFSPVCCERSDQSEERSPEFRTFLRFLRIFRRRC
jgi:hypothetical protein